MRVLSLAAVAAASFASPALAQSLKSNEILSSAVVRPLAKPHPVLGADNRVHLAYELMFSNASKMFLTIDKVEAVDPSGRVLRTMEGDHLRAMTMLYNGDGTTLPGGGTGIVFMDVSFAPDEQLPKSVAARITATRQGVGPDGKPGPLPPGLPVPATFTFTAGSTDVGAPARVIEPPLRGPRWFASNGCCDRITPHRGAIITVNGVIQAPERFAIDWEQLDEQNRMFDGEKEKLSSWKYYGAPIYSVADGTVVNLWDESDEQVPGPPEPVSTEAIGGNMLVVDIGGGAYAFYAHLQRGSLKAKLGDKVKAGQVLGLLGNTGNSTAPHLHFHLMDGPSPLNSNGLPYVFPQFTSTGVVPAGEEDALEEGKAATIEKRLTGEHRNQLPMDNQMVDFGEAP
ncbi:MAG TPA: M23 family metallopeptidase [Sphingomicrobium sp.]|nr:M23 family metallopeptidase [Sphingomicrobium sp.]